MTNWQDMTTDETTPNTDRIDILVKRYVGGGYEEVMCMTYVCTDGRWSYEGDRDVDDLSWQALCRWYGTGKYVWRH